MLAYLSDFVLKQVFGMIPLLMGAHSVRENCLLIFFFFSLLLFLSPLFFSFVVVVMMMFYFVSFIVLQIRCILPSSLLFFRSVICIPPNPTYLTVHTHIQTHKEKKEVKGTTKVKKRKKESKGIKE